MSKRLRIAVILFALASPIFWTAVVQITVAVREVYHDGGRSKVPAFNEWLMFGLPAVMYALVCILFIRWVVKRTAYEVLAKRKPDV